MVPLRYRENIRKYIIGNKSPKSFDVVNFYHSPYNITSFFEKNFSKRDKNENITEYINRIAKNFLWPDCLNDKELVSALNCFGCLEIANFYMLKYNK